jgi:hypothetical protein
MTRGVYSDPIKELERQKKIGAAQKGRIVSEETRRKPGAAKKGKNNPLYPELGNKLGHSS